MKYDVVVVGAGPAGSTAAKCLAEKGIKALLLDKEDFPRKKPCGGGLPTRVLKKFPYVNELVDSISYGSITHSSSFRYEFEIIRDKPLLAMILRDEFDFELIKLAQKSGATFQGGKKVEDVIIQNNKPKIVLEGGKEIETQMVLGCDGMRSVVAKKAGLCKKHEKICVCIMQEQPMTAKQLDHYFTDKRITHIFNKIQGIAGYGWIFPKKEGINIGLGEFRSAIDTSKSKSKLKDVYEKYITTLKENKILPKDFPMHNLEGGTLPVFPLEKTYTDRVLLCGDAAGFVNPITGEGIYYAMASGEMAASVASEALKAKNTSGHYLSKYEKIWKNDFGKDLKLLGRFNNRWGKPTEKIVRLLTKDNTLAKLLVGVFGGQISFYEYRYKLLIRYLYASLKDVFIRNK
jgi:geranylgeranyl reductase family protein